MSLPKTINYQLMEATLQLINRDIAELPQDDLTRLALVEIRPRAEEFADLLFSCSISPNDPDNPGMWEDEEISRWPPKQDPYAQDYGKNFNEIGGGQGWFLRFLLDFRLFYNERAVRREDAVQATFVILNRVMRAIITDRQVYPRLRDDYGASMVRWDKAVKTMEVTPAGSQDETFLRGRMKLQFEVYRDA